MHNFYKLEMAAFCSFLKCNLLENRRGSIQCQNSNKVKQKLNKQTLSDQFTCVDTTRTLISKVIPKVAFTARRRSLKTGSL